MRLHLSPEIMSLIESHGQDHYPEEAAGLILGRVEGADRVACEILTMENTFDESQRATRYQIDPRAMIEAEREADSRGLELLGVFHSHPDHPARPSEFDREMALPWFIYLITRIQTGEAQESRGWQLVEDRGHFEEIPLHLERSEEAA